MQLEPIGTDLFSVKQEVNIDPLNDVKSVKSEPTASYSEEFIFNPNSDTSSSYAKTPKHLDDEVSQESTIPGSLNNNLNDDGEQAADATETLPESYSPLTTAKCTDGRLEQVLGVIGGLAAKWGYFENEVVYLVSKRLEIFFLTVTEATLLGELFIFKYCNIF